MKIIKLLFLGIVLVLCNLALLAAQTLPDTIKVSIPSAEPGGVMEVTVDARFHSSNVGGLVLVLVGLPNELISTEEGVELTTGVTAPTAAGTWYYQWTAGYGSVLKTNAGLSADVLMAQGDESASLTVTLLGANVAFYLGLPAQFGGIDPAAVGPMVKVWINVPADLPEGTYPVEVAEGGAVIASYTPAGLLDGVPVTSVDDLVIAEIPDNNMLLLDASLGAQSGGMLTLPVKIANRDTVGSGSFTLDYDDAVLTLDSVTAGTRAGGSSFTIASGALAAAVTKTINFSGGVIPTGGLGTLCVASFSIADVGAGTTASVSLAGVDLNDQAGTNLADVVTPSTGTTDLVFFFGDTLSFANMQGEGKAVIIDGQLHVPIVLKNTVAVSSVLFQIKEETGQEDVLSLASEPFMHVNRASGWMMSAVDSNSYVSVLAYDPYGEASIAAGNGTLFHVVFDINLPASQIPAPGGTTVDLDLALRGVQLIDGSGSLVGIQAVSGVASLDYRVPLGGENVGPGASLPKAFALSQNHPNPFNPSTTINYQVPDGVGSLYMTLSVYDIRGKLVRTLTEGLKGPGSYSAFWDGTDNSGRQIGSGVYFYRFSSAKYNATRKMILLK